MALSVCWIFQHSGFGLRTKTALFPENAISVFDNIKKDHTFYLDYRIKDPKVSEKWKIFYPAVID